jgi:serine/threonine-protein kinase PpkA
MHLLTSEGRHTHDLAARQYKALTQWGGGTGDLYFSIEAGSVSEFGNQVEVLASSIVDQIETAGTGKLIQIPAADKVSDLQLKTALVGRAMQLAYLGRKTGAEAPRLINAWVSERDFVNQALTTLQVRLMISKNQLSDLQQTLEAILEAGESTRINAQDFFLQLQSAAARLARDPENINEVKVKRLADVGQVAEWLEGLPYRSKIMQITEDDWLSWSISQQREFLDEVEEKIVLYRELHDDTDRWVALDEGRVQGDADTSIPLDVLP